MADNPEREITIGCGFDRAQFDALSKDQRWALVRDMQALAYQRDAFEGRLANLTRASYSPKFAMGDFFTARGGTTLWMVIGMAWEDSHGGYWRYQGWSERFQCASDFYNLDRDAYYRCSVMRRAQPEGIAA